MKMMRKLLYGLAIFLMVMPLLTCTMAFCPMKMANTNAVSGKIASMPCHGTMHNGGKQRTSPMMAVDCMGVKMFGASFAVDVPPSQGDIQAVHYALADFSAISSLQSANGGHIRGPPPEWLSGPPVSSQFPLFLSTQRIRI